MIRIGQAIDVHALVKGRKLILGGVEIEHDSGLLGHSDADVLLHAIAEALLGSLALGDLGTHFPDSDPAYKDIDSRLLLKEAYRLVKEKGYQLVNLDASILCQRPKLKNYIPLMVKNIADDLECDPDQISIKATTTEKLGFIGKEEGIAACCSLLVDSKTCES